MNYIIMITFIFQLVLIILASVFIPFFNEKGKNIATKQDIGKITENIEEIKFKYARHLDIYKTQKDNLSYQFYEDSSKLYNSLLYIGFDFDNENLEFAIDIDNQCDELITKKTKLTILFNKEKNIQDSLNNLTNITLKATTRFHHLRSQISELQSEAFNNNVYTKFKNEIKIIDVDGMKIHNKKIYDVLSEYIRDFHSLTPQFNQSRTEYLSAIQDYYEKLIVKI